MTGATTWEDLTGFQRDVLEAIASIEGDGRQPYGLAIKRKLNKWYDEEINHGRLYPNLDQLVDAGLVEKGAIDQRTNSYELTARGRDMLEERVRDLAETVGISPLARPATDGGSRR